MTQYKIKKGIRRPNYVQNMVQFQTAWSIPEGVYHALSKRFPSICIFVEYADEDLGSNCGTYCVQNGESTTSHIEGEEALQFACDIWGYDFTEVLAERDCDV